MLNVGYSADNHYETTRKRINPINLDYSHQDNDLILNNILSYIDEIVDDTHG